MKKVIILSAPETPTTARTRKRKKNGDYTGEVRSKRARYVIEHGNTATAGHFLKKIDTSLNERRVRGMVSLWKDEKLQFATDITRSPRSCPLKLDNMDRKLCEYKENHVLQVILLIPEFTQQPKASFIWTRWLVITWQTMGEVHSEETIRNKKRFLIQFKMLWKIKIYQIP